MKKAVCILLISTLVTVCSACRHNQTDGSFTGSARESTLALSSQGSEIDTMESDALEESKGTTGSAENRATSDASTDVEVAAADDTKAEPGNDGMYAVSIVVGNKVFAAKFYDNESTGVLIDQMPMVLDMRDYAGQEKVLALDYDFPSATIQTPPTIRTGDIYLYSGNRLVLFYTTFSNSYSYVPIGYIEDATGLASALGDGNVLVTFSAL